MDLIKDNIPDIRFFHDMKDFVYDEKWFASAPNFEVYYMYRGLAKDANDRNVMAGNNLRYDITVMPSQMLGIEFPKTIGHEHAVVPGTDLTYTEIYEVLEGEAHYLLQKFEAPRAYARASSFQNLKDKNGRIVDIYVVITKKGEKCVIPPNYGHVTINASGKELIMANWVEANFKSDYSLFQKNRSAGYYALSAEASAKADVPFPSVIASPAPDGTGRSNPANTTQAVKWLKNKNYGEVPKLKIYEAKDFNYLLEQFAIDPKEPMYNLVNKIEKLDFLKNPQKYNWDF